MSYRCRICDREFDTIPDTAVLLNHRGRNRVYRFIDGIVHDLIHGRALHKRCHKTTKVDGCEFCFPPPKPEPQPEPPVEQVLQEVEVVELPEPQPEIKLKPEIIVEEVVPATTMAAAFHRIFKS